MKTLLIIFLLISSTSFAQTIAVNSYIRSANIIPKTGAVTFRPKGSADYPVIVSSDAVYNFTVSVSNLVNKPVFAYILSPIKNVWTNTTIPIKTGAQTINIKASLTTLTPYVRLYFADSVSVDKISYTIELPPPTLAELVNRIKELEESLSEKQADIDALTKKYDALPNLYFKGFVTKDTTGGKIILNTPPEMREIHMRAQSELKFVYQNDNIKGLNYYDPVKKTYVLIPGSTAK